MIVGDRRYPRCIVSTVSVQVGDCQNSGTGLARNPGLCFAEGRIVVGPDDCSASRPETADCSSRLPRLDWGSRAVRLWGMLNRYCLVFERLPERQDRWHPMPALNDSCDVRFRRA